LLFTYTNITAIVPNQAFLTFLPNGSFDMTRTSQTDLDTANTILAPAFNVLQQQIGHTFDFWQVINWIFVSFYWAFLADFGQVNPSILNLPTQMQIALPQTNNIFINNTLFEQYYSFLQDTVIPIIFPGSPSSFFPTFNNVSDVNSLHSSETTFIRSYSCVVRMIKSPINFIISVVVGDYVFINGAYVIVIWVGAWIQERRNKNGKLPVNQSTADFRHLRWNRQFGYRRGGKSGDK
jgi:hypothetical protein